MINFGYSIHKDNQINMDAVSMELLEKVKKREPSVMMCMACGSCAATCSAAQFTSFSLRHLMLKVCRGQMQGLEKEAEKCMLCGKCQLVCPRGVNTRNVIIAIRSVLEEPVNE